MHKNEFIHTVKQWIDITGNQTDSNCKWCLMCVDHAVINIFRQPNQMPTPPWFELRFYSEPLPDQQAFHPLLGRARQSMHRGEGRKEDQPVTHLLIWPVTQEQDWDTLTPPFGAGSQYRYPAQAKRSTSSAKA